MRLTLPSWRPDAAALQADVLADMRNAVPTAEGWRSEQGLMPVLDAVLSPPVQGIFAARRADGALELFAAYNGSIRRIASRTAEPTDLSKAGGYNASRFIRFRGVQYGDLFVVSNFEDPMQAYALGAGGAFDDLSEEAPRARYLAVVRDLIVAADTDYGDGENVYRVGWHGFGPVGSATEGLPDPTRWTPDLATQADFQVVADIGQITGLTGGEFGTVIGEGGVARMVFTGSRFLFQFDVVERRIGCRVPQSVVQYRQQTYFLSPSGFMAFDGSQIRPIGLERVDRFFARDFQEDAADLMWAVPDVDRQRVRWLYPGLGFDGETANRILDYYVNLDEWAISDARAECLGSGRTFGFDLDDPAQFPNLDEMDVNLDDPSLWRSLPATLAVTDGRISGFSGAVQPAYFEWAEREFTPDVRTMLTEAVLIHRGGTARLRVGKRERYDGGMSWGKEHGPQSDGVVRFREPGRSHSLRLSLTGDWARATGVDVRGVTVGGR